MRKDKKAPTTYTWVSSDGTRNIIIPGVDGVSETDLLILSDLDRLEANDDRRNRRHNVSFEVFIDHPDYEKILMDTETDVERSVVEKLDRTLMRRALHEAEKELTPAQMLLLEQVYVQELSVREIARREGISDVAIHKRLRTVLKKMKKSFR